MTDIATVKDLIEHLEKSFSPTDKLAFFDEGGAWCELVHVEKGMIGSKGAMFNYVKDKRQNELDRICRCEDDAKLLAKAIEEGYQDVEQNAVVIY